MKRIESLLSIPTDAQNICINNILYTVSTATCFETCVLLKLQKLLKFQLNKSSRLNASVFVVCDKIYKMVIKCGSFVVPNGSVTF